MLWSLLKILTSEMSAMHDASVEHESYILLWSLSIMTDLKVDFETENMC
jgi:hypothetical protein